jgi:DNA mismatch endonuclease (patch repair protein)
VADRLSPERRSWLMSRVKGKGTAPELAVRRLAHSLGMRFRLHKAELPGRPDLVFPRYRTVVFVHGCFWHRHAGCRKATSPKSRIEYWEDKFRANIERDERNAVELERMGWRVLTVWECETKNAELLKAKLDFVRSIKRGTGDGRH